jgi:hypothetical protein
MKLYNENEIGAILRRAAEMSLDESGPNAAGLSIEELQQVGLEAGLDPDLILRAAAEMQQRGPKRPKNFFGGPLSYSNDFVLDGEIDAAIWEEMISSIRGSFKDPGVVSTRESVFEWTSQSETEKAQVTALIKEGKTKFTVFWTEPIMAIPMFAITLVGTLISLPIAFEALELSGPLGLAFIMTVFSSLFFLSRLLVSRLMDDQVSKLQQLETTLDLIASKKALRTSRERHQPAKSSPSEDTVQAALLYIDEEPAETTQTSQARACSRE